MEKRNVTRYIYPRHCGASCDRGNLQMLMLMVIQLFTSFDVHKYEGIVVLELYAAHVNFDV